MRVTDGKTRVNSLVTFLYWPLHIIVPVLPDQLCKETRCSLEDLPGVMDDRGRMERET